MRGVVFGRASLFSKRAPAGVALDLLCPAPRSPFLVVLTFTWTSGGAGRRLPGQTRAGLGMRRLARSVGGGGAGGE